jgi:hypothetical protein
VPRSGGPRLAIGSLLLLAYAASAFWPLSGAPLPLPPEPAPWYTRLFPGVPIWWVAARIATALAGAALVGRALVLERLPPLLPPRWSEAPPAAGRARAAFAVAACHAALAPFAARLPAAAGLPYLLALALPPLLLLRRDREPPARAGVAGAAAVALAWLALRTPAALADPRVATPVDLWQSFGWLVDVQRQPAPVLAASGQAGIGNAFLLLLGIDLMPAGPAAFTWIQGVHGLWLAAAGLGVGVLAARLLGPGTAPLASATALFSPFVLLLPLSPSAFGVFLAIGVATLLAGLAFARTGAPAAVAALGALGGLCLSSAYLHPLALAAALATFVLLVRRDPRPRWLYWGVPLLLGVAAGWPSLPDANELREMHAHYVARRGSWSLLEAILTGQRAAWAPPGMSALWTSGSRGPLDLALSTLLSPLAIPRTPLRLWGDSLLEPLSAAAAAVGFVLWLRAARRDATARALLLFAAFALAPAALASAYDRASPTRNLLLPVAAALAAAWGMRPWLARVGPRIGLLAPLAVALSGVTLFDLVTPRVVASSWLTVALEATAGTPPDRAIVLEAATPARLPWLHEELIASYATRRPPRIRSYAGPEALASLGEEVVLWSPALEDLGGVGMSLCARSPGASLYMLQDRAHRARAFAGQAAAGGWAPALARDRWVSFSCAEARTALGRPPGTPASPPPP